jgi:hypothetical protein
VGSRRWPATGEGVDVAQFAPRLGTDDGIAEVLGELGTLLEEQRALVVVARTACTRAVPSSSRQVA